MPETQEKLELLRRIAHRFNEAQIEWALGASLMLFLKGIVSEFHDIDLMVSVQDAERAKAILSEKGRVFDCSLRENQVAEQVLLGTEVIPLQSPLLWCKYYRLMGRAEKADMIEKALAK